MKSLLLRSVNRTRVSIPSTIGLTENAVVKISTTLNKNNLILSYQSKPNEPVNIHLYSIELNMLNLLAETVISPQTYLNSDISPMVSSNSDLISSLFIEKDSILTFLSSGLVIETKLTDLSSIAIGVVEEGISQVYLSPDGKSIAIFTGFETDLLLLASGSLETIARVSVNSEKVPKQTPVNIGWGSSETQFKGTGAKAAEREATAALKHLSISIDQEKKLDDDEPHVNKGLQQEKEKLKSHSLCWHPDSSRFVISFPNGSLRVYSRDATLLSESINNTPVPGSPMSWKGVVGHGFGIAALKQQNNHPNLSSQSYNDFSIWEPNCLEHISTSHNLVIPSLPSDNHCHGQSPSNLIGKLAWNSSGDILLVAYFDGKLQLYTTTCYKFDLKREIPSLSSGLVSLVDTVWTSNDHLLNAYIHISPKGHMQILLDSFRFLLAPALDGNSGFLIVPSGPVLKVTPAAQGIIPPPLCRWEAHSPSGSQLPLACLVCDTTRQVSDSTFSTLVSDSVEIDIGTCSTGSTTRVASSPIVTDLSTSKPVAIAAVSSDGLELVLFRLDFYQSQTNLLSITTQRTQEHRQFRPNRSCLQGKRYPIVFPMTSLTNNCLLLSKSSISKLFTSDTSTGRIVPRELVWNAHSKCLILFLSILQAEDVSVRHFLFYISIAEETCGQVENIQEIPVLSPEAFYNQKASIGPFHDHVENFLTGFTTTIITKSSKDFSIHPTSIYQQPICINGSFSSGDGIYLFYEDGSFYALQRPTGPDSLIESLTWMGRISPATAIIQSCSSQTGDIFLAENGSLWLLQNADREMPLQSSEKETYFESSKLELLVPFGITSVGIHRSPIDDYKATVHRNSNGDVGFDPSRQPIWTTTVAATVDSPSPVVRLYSFDYSHFSDSVVKLNLKESHACELGSTLLFVGLPASITLLVMPRGSIETIYSRMLLKIRIKDLCQQNQLKKAFELALTHRYPLASLLLAEDDSQTGLDSSAKLLVGYLDTEQLIQVMADPSATPKIRSSIRLAATQPGLEGHGTCCEANCQLPTNQEHSCHKQETCIKFVSVIVAADLLSGNIDQAMGFLAFYWHLLSENKKTQLVAFSLTLVARERPSSGGGGGAELLLAAALGTYCLPLALAVAEQGLIQRDPQEYLQFLSILVSKDTSSPNVFSVKGIQLGPRERFLVDDRLKRYEKAFSWLVQDPSVTLEEIISFIEKRSLYSEAFSALTSAEPLSLPSSENSDSQLKMQGCVFQGREAAQALLGSYARSGQGHSGRAFLAVGMALESFKFFMEQKDLIGILASHFALISAKLITQNHQIMESAKLWDGLELESDGKCASHSGALFVAMALGDKTLAVQLACKAASSLKPTQNLNIQSNGHSIWESSFLLCLSEPDKAKDLLGSFLLPALRIEVEIWCNILTKAMDELRQLASSLILARARPEVDEFDDETDIFKGEFGSDSNSVISYSSTGSSVRSRSSKRSTNSTCRSSTTTSSSSTKADKRKKKSASKPNSPAHEWFLLGEVRLLAEPLLYFSLHMVQGIRTLALCSSLELYFSSYDNDPFYYCKLLSGDARLPYLFTLRWNEFVEMLNSILSIAPIKKQLVRSELETELLFRDVLIAHSQALLLVELYTKEIYPLQLSLI